MENEALLERYKQELELMFSKGQVPGLGRKLSGWDYVPGLLKQYYDHLTLAEQKSFRQAVLELFSSEDPKWQFNLLDVCLLLKMREAIPVMEKLIEIKVGESRQGSSSLFHVSVNELRAVIEAIQRREFREHR